jgi:hypothetical protein
MEKSTDRTDRFRYCCESNWPACAAMLALQSINKFAAVVLFLYVGSMFGLEPASHSSAPAERPVYRFFFPSLIKIYYVYGTHTCFKALFGAETAVDRGRARMSGFGG